VWHRTQNLRPQRMRRFTDCGVHTYIRLFVAQLCAML
jgi:hypothetical protein